MDNMRSYIKVDKLKIAQINKYNVLNYIGRKEPINRAALVKWTQLSLPTIMAITGELLEKGAIRSIGKGEIARNPAHNAGKPPEMLEVNPDFFYIVGVDLGRTTVRIVINDAVSRQKFCYEEVMGDPFPVDDFISRLNKLILNLIKSQGIKRNRILGAGVAMPGLIENVTGRVIISPDFGWMDVPLQSQMEKALPFPILVKNSNHALALHESSFEGDNYRASFCVNLGYGIGAALVIGDELYAGARGADGEVGHSVIEKGGPLCKCGNSGCLESMASGEAIARQAATIAAHHGKTKITELCDGDISKIDARMVFQAAEGGDEGARKIISAAADYIGMGISTAVNILDPDRVILCGGLMKNGPYFFEKIRSCIGEHVMHHSDRKLEVTVGRGGEFSTAQGACQILLHTYWTEQRLPI
jgi:predicted NBD/HSP70 family sugar kinase